MKKPNAAVVLAKYKFIQLRGLGNSKLKPNSPMMVRCAWQYGQT
ncbi:hypothetical protein C427_4999 [Paraglaciecola psychrophila 170]|uniref:Uncharacterized protein n=1 Tax=Paraglaciecola psychrophila 170 TaxID=1129794 RepID=M4RWR0_9ALTE|nr:hypothetical protein C427_4999 [Paraglaciecola psychrophila 170]